MTDLYIVLGCGVLESKRRAKFAAELVSQTPEIPLILTGGMPKRIPPFQYPKMTEAEYMREVFQKRNLPNPLYLEESAKTTAQNLLHSRRLIKSTPALNRVHNVSIINGKAHLPRTQWLSRILLKDYEVTEIPVPVFANGSSLLEILHGISFEALSSVFEIQARKKNEHAFAEWAAQQNPPEDFPGTRMVYNSD